MKKVLLFCAFAVSFLMIFAGCGTSSFGVSVNENFNVEINAVNASEGMTGAAGTFSVSEGDTVQIEPAFDEGMVLVEFYPISGADENADIDELMPDDEPEFDVEVSGNEPIQCGFAPGDYLVSATVKEKTNGTALISKFNEDDADSWTKVPTAMDAAVGAGNMDEFDVPAELKINDLTFTDPKFSYQDGVAQAYYESGAIGISVRKACGIYGGAMTERDLDSFPQHWTQQAGDDSEDVVDCYGMNKDSAIVIQWGDENEFYTVTSQGLGGEEYGMDAATIEWLEDEID